VKAEKMDWKPRLKKGETFMDLGDGKGFVFKDGQCRGIEVPMAIRAYFLIGGLRTDPTRRGPATVKQFWDIWNKK
jgi:hypothetical protein